MSAQTPLDPFVMYSRAADARPTTVDTSRWNDWQMWKQTAAAATAEYKRAVERTDPSSIPEDVWQKTAEADKAMEEGHQSYAVVEKLIAEAAKLRTDAERAALQFANVQAAMQAPSNLNLNGHVTVHPPTQQQTPSAHALMSTDSASPPETGYANGSAARAPKVALSSASKNASSPHVNNPVCDNCRLAGNVLCVRAAHPHHRRCTYCFENDTRCSFKESKAAAAAENGDPAPAAAVRKPRASQQPSAVPIPQQQQQPVSAIPVQSAPAPPASAPPTATPARQAKRKREPGASDDSDEEMGQPQARRYTPPAPPPFAAAVPMGVQSYGQMSVPQQQPQVQYQPQVHYHQQPTPQVQYQPPQPQQQRQRRTPTVAVERRPSQAQVMPQPRANLRGDLQTTVANAQALVRTIGFLFGQLEEALDKVGTAIQENED